MVVSRTLCAKLLIANGSVDGTQSIAWRINAETVAKDAERQAKIKAWHADAAPKQRKSRKSGISAREGIESQQRPVDPDFDRMFGKRGLKVSYGSLHDIESFPCEDGDRSKVSDASICVAGAHGQWIWNGAYTCSLGGVAAMMSCLRRVSCVVLILGYSA